MWSLLDPRDPVTVFLEESEAFPGYTVEFSITYYLMKNGVIRTTKERHFNPDHQIIVNGENDNPFLWPKNWELV